MRSKQLRPVGSGKTALMLALCRALRDKYSLAAVTNDIFTREDCEFLQRNGALPPAPATASASNGNGNGNDNNRISDGNAPKDRIVAIETGGCPHAAVREDISANLSALEDLHAAFDTDMLLIESGGDNLAANYSRELADFIIYVIDVSGGDKIPRKGGLGITQSDVLIVNKTDLAEKVGADLGVMERDARRMRCVSDYFFWFTWLISLQGRRSDNFCSGEAWHERKSHCGAYTQRMES